MDTKEQIVNSAIEVFKEMGYDQVSIPKICEKAGITKGTFYYYFQNSIFLCFFRYCRLKYCKNCFFNSIIVLN